MEVGGTADHNNYVNIVVLTASICLILHNLIINPRVRMRSEGLL